MAISDSSKATSEPANRNPLLPITNFTSTSTSSKTYAAHLSTVGIWSDVHAQNNVST